MKKFAFLAAGIVLLVVFAGRIGSPRSTPVAAGVTGGVVVLMGIDAEDGGPGGHGPSATYADILSSMLGDVTNGGSGILVLGCGKLAGDHVTTFWSAVQPLITPAQAVTCVNGAAAITAQSFAGFAIVAVVSDYAETSSGGVTNAENDALTARSVDIAAHVNGGGGLLGFSSTGLSNPYGYLGNIGAFTFFPHTSYSLITPTAPGLAIGITDALDLCCWHDEYLTFPSFLSVLATNTANGRPSAIGGAPVIITPGTDRISVDSSEVQGNSTSTQVSMSDDGSLAAFASSATNLVASDTNGASDVFVRDRLLGTTERVSIDTSEAQANATSANPSISGDGRYVVFSSSANNLVAGDTNAAEDVFVRDRQAGTTERLSVDSTGTQGSAASFAVNPGGVSADGRYVTFCSDAANLTAGDTNGTTDTFVRDRLTNTTERVSVDSAEVQGNARSCENSGSAISRDGNFVAFPSVATNLVSGDSNGVNDVFVRNRTAGTTERISLDSAAGQGNGLSAWPSLSADGRYVSFSSLSNNLVAGDTNGTWDDFVRDRQMGTTERTSIGNGGVEANANSGYTSLNSDGRYVAFMSYATNLVSGDTNGIGDVFVRDRQLATTTRASVDGVGSQGSGPNIEIASISISADGSLVAFYSAANNLVAGDTNVVPDAFVHVGFVVPPPPTITPTSTASPTATSTPSPTPTNTPPPPPSLCGLGGGASAPSAQCQNVDVRICYGGADPTGGALGCNGGSETIVPASTLLTQYTLVDVPVGNRIGDCGTHFVRDLFCGRSLTVTYSPAPWSYTTPGGDWGNIYGLADVVCNSGSDILAGPGGPGGPAADWPNPTTWFPVTTAGTGTPAWMNGGDSRLVPPTFPILGTEQATVGNIFFAGFAPLALSQPWTITTAQSPYPSASGMKLTWNVIGDPMQPATVGSFCVDSRWAHVHKNNAQWMSPATPGLYPRWTIVQTMQDIRSGAIHRTVDLHCVGVPPVPPDADGDCLEDAIDTNDANQDQDSDLLVDGIEVANGSSPFLSDTDGDGATDFDELFTFTDPTDTDSDNDLQGDRQDIIPISGTDTADAADPTDDNCPAMGNPSQLNTDSLAFASAGAHYGDKSQPQQDWMGDACDRDVDNDHLYDITEANLVMSGGLCAIGAGATNSLVADQDRLLGTGADQAVDGAECAFGANPTNLTTFAACVGGTDTPDVDRLCYAPGNPPHPAIEGFWRTRDISGFPFDLEHLCPRPPHVIACFDTMIGVDDKDSDGDGLADGTEVKYYATNPSNVDTDSDGCPDGKEAADINGDGFANSGDQGLLASIIVTPLPTWDPVRINRDMTKDGFVNSGDQGFLASIIVIGGGACPTRTGIVITRSRQ